MTSLLPPDAVFLPGTGSPRAVRRSSLCLWGPSCSSVRGHGTTHSFGGTTVSPFVAAHSKRTLEQRKRLAGIEQIGSSEKQLPRPATTPRRSYERDSSLPPG